MRDGLKYDKKCVEKQSWSHGVCEAERKKKRKDKEKDDEGETDTHYTHPEHVLPFSSAFNKISTVGSSLVKLEPHTLVIYQHSISEHCCMED